LAFSKTVASAFCRVASSFAGSFSTLGSSSGKGADAAGAKQNSPARRPPRTIAAAGLHRSVRGKNRGDVSMREDLEVGS
jgi:hypothetical protein